MNEKDFDNDEQEFLLIELKGAEKADAGKYERATSKCQDLIFKHWQICKIGIQKSQMVRFSEYNVFCLKILQRNFKIYIIFSHICQQIIFKIFSIIKRKQTHLQIWNLFKKGTML